MTVDQKRKLIEKHITNHPFSWYAEAIGLSRKCREVKEKKEISEDDALWKGRIEAVLFDDCSAYGFRRVTKALKRRGYVINKKKVLRIMKHFDLLQRRRRRFKPATTDSRHRLPTYPNLIKGLVIWYPDQLWVSDITYVRLPNGFCYLASVLDVFTRDVRGWCIMTTMTTELPLTALRRALSDHTAPEYHHSDRGRQYCAGEYTDELKRHGVKISMSEPGVSTDNAYAEAFFRTLKVEEVYLSEYETVEDAERSIGRFIQEVYRHKRLHSSLDYRPPAEFEREWLQGENCEVSLTA